jgi:hypothetical protein
MKAINLIRRNIANIPGWVSDRKIIVFESDDWGSIRMPSKRTFNKLNALGLDLESEGYARYNLYDTLANKDDLQCLFEVLDEFKDINGNPCIFTAVSVVANPDFKKIEENDYMNYYYEPFTKTLEAYYPGQNVFEMWQLGISKKVFFPQFHGREHLNISAWMDALRLNHQHTRQAFDFGFWGFVPDKSTRFSVENQAAFAVYGINDISIHREILNEGLALFKQLFGYSAKYFVPPNGPFNNALNETLWANGIRLRSTAKIQNESVGNHKIRKNICWLGKKDSSGIRYITRNCFFEPSQPGMDWIDSCLNDIKIAFRWRKPAIISSHRVNYIGVHDKKNRGNSLLLLRDLLALIKKEWPDCEFYSTDHLEQLMERN